MKACPRCRTEFKGGVMPERCRCGLAFTSDNKADEPPPYYRQGPSSDNKAACKVGHENPACALRGG